MHQELSAPGRPPEEDRWRARFDGRTFDVSPPLDESRAPSRTGGLAVEVDAHPEASEVPRRYDAFAGLVDVSNRYRRRRQRDAM